jgi:hypothetical protein
VPPTGHQARRRDQNGVRLTGCGASAAVTQVRVIS